MKHVNKKTVAEKKIAKGFRQTMVGVMAALLVSITCLPALSYGATIDERPSPVAMVADAVAVRPITLVSTVAGAGIFVATLPFSLLGGNTVEVGEKMVIVPFKTTFFRCLGCTKRHLRDRDEYY